MDEPTPPLHHKLNPPLTKRIKGNGHNRVNGFAGQLPGLLLLVHYAQSPIPPSQVPASRDTPLQIQSRDLTVQGD